VGFFEVYPYVVLGIVISVILPILRQSLPKPKEGKFLGKRFAERIWPIAEPYVYLGIASLVIGVLVVAFSGESLADWKAALLLGFSWDSILQKLGKA
jgi:hypothetical protein